MTDRSRLPNWISALVEAKQEVNDWPITRVIYPGTHDACTYGSGEGYTRVARFNWCCQNLNVYDQAKAGIRYFDLRFQCHDDGTWWPHHAEASKTGDILVCGPEAAAETFSIAQQLRRFIDENPGEILIMSFDVGPKNNHEFLRVVRDAFGGDGLFIRAPKDGNIPTVRQVRDEKRSLVLSSVNAPLPDDGELRQFANDYLWQQPGDGWHDSFYDEPVYKSNSPETLKKALGDWMNGRSEQLQRRDRFWSGQVMLTPSANNVMDVLKSTVSKDITASPQGLAKITNPFIRDNITKDEQWKKHASIIVFDFADEETALSIVNMNF